MPFKHTTDEITFMLIGAAGGKYSSLLKIHYAIGNSSLHSQAPKNEGSEIKGILFITVWISFCEQR